MAVSVPNSPRRDSRSFQRIVDAFLGGKDLPFAEVLSAERIERVFQKHGFLFGLHGVYTTASMVWSFLSQVLRDGKEGSCQAAIYRFDEIKAISDFREPPKSPTGEAARYTRNPWAALNPYVEDRRLAIDNNAAERLMKPVAIGRKNWLFFGSVEAGSRAAVLMSLVASCKLNQVEPWACLSDCFEKLAT